LQREKQIALIEINLREAKIVIESWRRHYNAIRPHASLGYRAPAPEVFVPALVAWPAAHATKPKLTSYPDHSVGADHPSTSIIS
jgi:hypothetical protein